MVDNALAKKLQIKVNNGLVLGCPKEVLPVFAGLDVVQKAASAKGELGFVVAFATTLADVERFAKLADEVASRQSDPLLWISYPKGSSKKYKCDFNRDTGWDALGARGFEPVRQVAIDEDWSALRFRKAEQIKSMTRSRALSAAGKERIAAKKAAVKKAAAKKKSR